MDPMDSGMGTWSSSASSTPSGSASGGAARELSGAARASNLLNSVRVIPPKDSEQKPLWRYVEVLDAGTSTGGNKKCRCRLCNRIISGSYSRVKAHLLKISNQCVAPCSKVTIDVLCQLNDEIARANASAARDLPREIPLPSEGVSARGKKRAGSAIESSFNVEVRAKLDGLIARMFYTAGLPFNVARNPYFRKAFIFACTHNIGGYAPPIYSMIRAADTDKPCLHLIYEMWDTMIEKVKKRIYRHEGKQLSEESTFFFHVHEILVARWTKSNTPLLCLAHSLNPKYYNEDWIMESPNRQAPHMSAEISEGRNKCFRKFFVGDELRKVKQQFADFSLFGNGFNSFDSIEDRVHLDPKQWWGIYGNSSLELKTLALKLLGQPASSSCAERNWSTYGLIHSSMRNRLNPGRAEDLVFVHQNLRLLSRKSEEYHVGPSTMWDIGGDNFESFDGGADFLQVADLTLDEPSIERVLEDLGALDLCEDVVPPHCVAMDGSNN